MQLKPANWLKHGKICCSANVAATAASNEHLLLPAAPHTLSQQTFSSVSDTARTVHSKRPSINVASLQYVREAAVRSRAPTIIWCLLVPCPSPSVGIGMQIAVGVAWTSALLIFWEIYGQHAAHWYMPNCLQIDYIINNAHRGAITHTYTGRQVGGRRQPIAPQYGVGFIQNSHCGCKMLFPTKYALLMSCGLTKLWQ